MEKLYFISDVHLGAHSGAVEKNKITKLLSFLNTLESQADYLYIVGDLYDFWFEYYKAIPKINLKIILKLCHLVESGTQVHYLTGNHDLWHNGYLEDEIGITVHHRPITATHNDLKLFVAHGDGLVKRNRTLRFLKKILQNRTNVFLYRLLHPDIGIPLAMKVSQKSKDREERRYEKDYLAFAHAKLQEGFDAVILGHTHIPLFESIDAGYYINLGDWMKKFTYLEMVGQKLELKSWKI